MKAEKYILTRGAHLHHGDQDTTDRRQAIDEHKNDQLKQQQEGKGQWKKELSSNSEAAVCFAWTEKPLLLELKLPTPLLCRNLRTVSSCLSSVERISMLIPGGLAYRILGQSGSRRDSQG